MSVITFDTHKFVRKLKESGFDDRQAEALTDAVQESQAAADVATKADLEKLGSDLRREMAEMKFDLVKWIIGIGIAQTGVLVALKLLV